MKLKNFTLDLALFGEGGAATGGESAPSSVEGVTAQPLSEEASVTDSPSAEEAIAARSRELYEAKLKQAKEVLSVYPEFDFKRAMTDPTFARLIRNNVDMRTAYEVSNSRGVLSRMVDNAARKAVFDTVNKMSNSMLANQLRPAENGASANSAAVVKRDVSKMTRQERQEIIKRVQRGEKISF